jgi:proton-dependent oligopeptide transporter, POT family
MEVVDGNRVLHDPTTGYLVAFLFPAVLMAVALTAFALGKRYYAVEVIDRTPPPPGQRAERWKVLGQLFGLFLLVLFFWAIFDQHTSTWILFAQDYLDLNVSLPFGYSYEVPPDQIQALNPIFIVTFLPLTVWLWRVLDRKGIRIRPTDKMILGFLLTAVTMGIHAGAGYAAVRPDGSIEKVSILWQIAAFVVITLAEILISVTGLELAFTAAPQSMKGFVTACWLVVVGMANLFVNTPVSRLYPSTEPGWHFESAGGYFGMLTIAMLVVTGAFFFVARRFNKTAAAGDPRRDMAAAE